MKRSWSCGCACGILMLWSAWTAADTLVLKDGSLWMGLVSEAGADHYRVTSPVFGEVSIPRSNVLYRAADDPNTVCESYQVMAAGLGVLCRLDRTVPDRMEGRDRFSLLVPGDVWTVTDPLGQPLPFVHRPIAQTSHVTLDFNDLPPGTRHVVVTTWQAGLLERTPSGDSSLGLHYIPDQEQDVHVIVTFPATMKVQAAEPQAEVVRQGLVVWRRHLSRQQQFMPELTLGLAGLRDSRSPQP
jgi:hypothetical protein